MWRIEAIKNLCNQAIKEHNALVEESGDEQVFELEEGRAELAEEILEILKEDKNNVT